MVVIISCGAKKLDRPARARDLYVGPYFKAALAYALTLTPPENIFILSAKYGLVGLDDRLKPYDLRMGQPGSVKIKTIIRQAERLGVAGRYVVALGGRSYVSVIRKIWFSVWAPLEGKGGLGDQISLMRSRASGKKTE